MNATSEKLTQLSDLIGLIYEGATDARRWSKDILPAIVAYIDAPVCMLFTVLHPPQNGGYYFIHGMAQDQIDLYMNMYHQHDPWAGAAYAKMMGEGEVLLGDELVPRDQLIESKFYKEYIARDKNLSQLLTSVVFGLDTSNALPTPVICAFLRSFEHRDFNQVDAQRLRLILPHLSRSLGVMHLLKSAQLFVETSLAALKRLPSAVLLLNNAGEVTFVNQAAQRMLNDDDGLQLSKLSNAENLGMLCAEKISDSEAINNAISAALSRAPNETPHFSNCVPVPRKSGKGCYTLQFSALGEHNEFNSASGTYALIIFLNDSEQDIKIDPAILQSAYGLTPAEAKVAIALLESGSARELASKLGISQNTVGTQVKAIYAKLGVDTRTRFVKLLLGLARHHS
jgi:DNA-binding CsgD family transcriptional regulator